MVGEGKEKEDIKKNIYDLNMQKEILILGHRKDMARLMNICDIVVNPSIEPEPFGRTIIEAMACGKVVIATDMGGPREIIENKIDGFLVNPKADELAKTILEILNDEELIKSMGKNARKKVFEKFSIERQIREIERMYSDLICGR